jgi:hypothetical protein
MIGKLGRVFARRGRRTAAILSGGAVTLAPTINLRAGPFRSPRRAWFETRSGARASP